MARKKDVELHKENPFIKELDGMKRSTKRRTVTAKSGKAVIDLGSGKLEDVAEIVSVHQVDNEQFVKLFTSNLKQFFSLKPTSYRIVQVLLSQLGKAPRRDMVYLNMSVTERYFTETDQKSVSRSAYYGGMKELIEKQFIAESVDPNLYWINPTLFFNGDRVRFVKEFHNTEFRQQELTIPSQSDVRLLDDAKELENQPNPMDKTA